MRAAAFMVVLSIFLLSTAALAGDSTTQAARSEVSRMPLDNSSLSRGPRAEVPGLMNYQGTLTDAGGVALDTTVSMTFSIYTDSTGGSLIWTETQPAVEVNSGIFNVLLGRVNTILDTVFNDPSRWLGIQVGGDPELQPRQRIAAVGYAFWAAEADTAEYARSAAVSDGDWTVSNNILYPAGDYGLSMRSWNVMHGQHDSTHINFGIACTTGTSGQDDKYCTVGGGYSNTASGSRATVGGGGSNTANGEMATVGGGLSNTADTSFATVGGGYYNTASGEIATVGGGFSNFASGYMATVGGGRSNTADTSYATVGGGRYNTASGSAATMGGGYYNAASGEMATVGGGYRDTVYARYGGVAAGYSNLAGDTATDVAAFVGGGYDNSATGTYSTVGGGFQNTANDDKATIGGGRYNTASGGMATVGGGESNTASSSAATVSGGYNNIASDIGATAGGGYNNTASDWYATVGGGYDNSATGYAATVGGGSLNDSDGDYSFTVGNNSNVSSSHSNSAAFNGQNATASGQTRVGTISKASGTFTIDHPTEPMNKILNHYFAESPEMVLIYRGIAIIGSDGRAEVHLPDYFDALNRNPMVQLTGVGTSDVYVSEKVTGNRFVIGGKPGTEVYWTVTGDRKDPSAEITRILMPVEQLKEDDLAGHSLDDDFLAATMSQLERMGQAGKFSFRTQAGREKYEKSRQALENPGPMEPGWRD